MSAITPGTLPVAAERYRRLDAAPLQETLAGTAPRRVFVDLETTGFDPGPDRIIEVGVVAVEAGETVEEYQALVVPGRSIPADIEVFTGITREMVVAEGVSEAEAAGELARLLDTAHVVAFNAPFEERFLSALAERSGVAITPAAYLDALELARIVLPRLGRHRQIDLCDFFGIEEGPAHRALADARSLARLFPVLLAGVQAMEPAVRGAIAALSPETAWALRPLFAAGGARPTRPDFARWRRAAPRHKKADVLADANDAVIQPLDPAVVESDFAKGGPLHRAGYEARAGQALMAQAVTGALDDQSHLVVEAGTGTGKSLAYLVPAARFAVANGVRVVVATHSTALQDQLLDRDIPGTAAALGLDVGAVTLKGYDHYLCLRRFARLWDGEKLAAQALALAAMITSWVADSAWDELDSLNIHSLGTLEGLIRAGQATCLKETCRFAKEGTCFMWGQRRRAAAAHLLVVNHALLLANVRCEGALYPPARYAIVDEAHKLEEAARDALAMTLSRQRAGGVLATLAGRGSKLVAVERMSLGRADEAAVRERGKDVGQAARDGLAALKSLFGALLGLLPAKEAGRRGGGRSLWLSPAVRERESFEEVASAAMYALDRVSGTIHAMQLLEKTLDDVGLRLADPIETLAEAAADVTGWREEMELAASVLGLLVEGASEDLVVWLEVDRRPDFQDETVKVAPLDVGDELARGLFDGHRSVVCTSATLDAGDSFKHFTSSVGLDRVDRPPELLKVPSPFDFATQMGVYVVSDMPDPRDEGYRQALASFLVELHRASAGGALTLFTSRSDMESVHEVVEPLLAEEGLPLLCQGRAGSTRRLADEFRADPSASLMATRSFWQGFDAPGETLRVVVIARLPFGFFGDPLAEALRERVGQSRWWADHYLPKAVLDLKQAAGRLIRSPTDRGVVVLADSRVSSKHYGQRFLRALPTREAIVAPAREVVDRTAAMFGG